MADCFDKMFSALMQWFFYFLYVLTLAAVGFVTSMGAWNRSQRTLLEVLSGFSRLAGAAHARGRWPEIPLPTPVKVRAVPPATVDRRRT